MSDSGFERLDVIAIGPHPDDLEITCGGTLARLVKQGYQVGMIDLTTGEPTPRGSEEIRAREAEAALKVLDVPVRINLKLPNRELMDGPPARYALATELRRYRPSIIIGLAGRTPAASPDHHQGHMIVEAARFYPGDDPAGRLVELFNAVRSDLQLRAFLSPRILESLYVLRDVRTLPFFRDLLTAGFTDHDPERCEVTRALVMVRRFTGRAEPNAKYPDALAPEVAGVIAEAEAAFERSRAVLTPVVVI